MTFSSLTKSLCFGSLLAALSLNGLAQNAAPAAKEDFPKALERVGAEYAKRLEQASGELAATRARIQAEKLPLIKAQRAAEERILAAQRALTEGEIGKERFEETRRSLLREYDALRKNLGYLDTLADENLRALRGGALSPAEPAETARRLAEVQARLDDDDGVPDGQAGVAMSRFLLDQVSQSLGGRSVPGRALVGEERRVEQGTFVILGPETFFVGADPARSGTVRRVEGAALPQVFPVASWKSSDAEALARGELAAVPSDASSGKALRLVETKGTVWDHIRKGGVVAFVIIGVGLVSLVMIVLKIRDLSAMSVDSPEAIRSYLSDFEKRGPGEARAGLSRLGASSRELFEKGLENLGESKEILEERLYAVLMSQRLHFERRLPLLAVIATAAPLMGLLGTVMGMVKTFALITVFGTGNAGKLASGISEVLVATELGLMVAIPTLIAHGFLAHRIQKNLSLLERYAFEFVTAAQTRRPVPARKETVSA